MNQHVIEALIAFRTNCIRKVLDKKYPWGVAVCYRNQALARIKREQWLQRKLTHR